MQPTSARFVLGFDDKTPSDNFLRLVESRPPGGIILFERNFENLEGLADNIRVLREAAPHALIMIDEEGGVKSRLRVEHGFPNPPDPREVARTMTSDMTREAYKVAGRALKRLGIDVDLGPVLDVAPENHFLAGRSFSDNPDICSHYGIAVIQGLMNSGICPCAKHFPGLGAAELDPHTKTAVSSPEADFDNVHFFPFRTAIYNGVPAIMTTHIRAEQLDSWGDIATLSRPIIEMLRKKLGFHGVILSDDLLMGGATAVGNLSDVAIGSMEAGHDMVLICKEVPEVEEIIIRAERKFENVTENLSALKRIEVIEERFHRV